MGYNLSIGEAKVEPADEYGGQVEIGVAIVTNPNAPHIANENINENSNQRWPSYTAWCDFVEAVELKALFFDEEEGLLAQHPGAVYLLHKHAKTLTEALDRYRSRNPDALPGFVLELSPWATPEQVASQERPPKGKRFDATLARLVWCEWWVRWALDNCTVPIFKNS